MLCDALEGGMGREAQEGGKMYKYIYIYIYIYLAESHCYTAETSTTFKATIIQLKTKRLAVYQAPGLVMWGYKDA